MFYPEEFGTDLRGQAADRFETLQLSDLNPDVYKDMLIADFIGTDLRMADYRADTRFYGFDGLQTDTSNYMGFLLTSKIVPGTDATDRPVGWRIIAPHVEPQTTVQIDFATDLGGDQVNKSLTQEATYHHINRDVTALSEVHPVFKELFPIFGDRIVDMVRSEGHTMISGIERVIRTDIDGDAYIWNRLVYSRCLLNTVDVVERYIAEQDNDGVILPAWMHSISTTEQRNVLAAGVAISALYMSQQFAELGIQ